MGLFILRFPHFLILTIVVSLLLLFILFLLKVGDVLEGSRLLAHGAWDGGAAAVTTNDVGRTGEGGRQVLRRTAVKAHGVSLPARIKTI